MYRLKIKKLSLFLDDDFIDMDTLEDYDEELDGFEEDNEEIDKDVIMKE